MDDFFTTKRHDPFRRDPFFDDTFFPPNYHRQFQNPFSILHDSMRQMQREMDLIMHNAFNNINQFESRPFNPQYPSIEQNQLNQKQITNKDQDLDKQIQKYGLENVLNDDSYLSEWDFVKQLEKETPLNQPNPNMHYYGRSNVYTYRSDGTGRVEERKMVQDSKGNRMESIKKQLDDKIWAKSVRRNEKGEIDEDEKLINMDDTEKERFINDWKSNRENRYVKSINFTNNNNMQPAKIDNEMNPTHVSLPSLDQSKQDKNSKNWYEKLKFWK